MFGPLATSGNGKQYIMVMTDAFNKYVELVALPNKTAEVVAKAIYETWISRYSTPKVIVTDGGKEFANQILNGLCDHLGIVHKQTSPYHPECNAAVEVFNRTMRQFLQAAMEAPFLEWESLLPALRISYNTSVSKATKKTPFSLVFGMRPNMPFFDFEKVLTYDESHDDIIRELEAVRKLAEEQNIKYRKMYAEQYDKKYKTSERPLAPGDEIYIENRAKKGGNPKLQPLFLGPYKVVEVTPTDAYYMDKNARRVVHLNRAKRAILPENLYDEFPDSQTADNNISRKKPDEKVLGSDNLKDDTQSKRKNAS